MIDQGYKQCDLPDRDTEFRVCVSIHEARNLEGVDCNPLLRVACRCGQQIKKTRSSRGSINPKFNEVSKHTVAINKSLQHACYNYKGEELYFHLSTYEDDGENNGTKSSQC